MIIHGSYHGVIVLILLVSTIVMTNYKSTSTGKSDEEIKCEKCMRLIEAAFGPDKPIDPEDSATGPTIPNSPIVMFEKGSKVSERSRSLAEGNIVNATTPEEGDEKLIQKLEKIEETPLVDAEQKRPDELNSNRTTVWFSDRDMCSASTKLSGDVNILDKLAKRCMNAPNNKVDSKLLEEMEKIGILQPHSQEPSNVPAMEDEIVQMGCPRKLERDKIKMPRRNFLNRRAMRHLNMTSASHNISNIKESAQREPMMPESNAVSQETLGKCEGQQESTVNNETNLHNAPHNLTGEEQEQNNMEEIVKKLYEERKLDSSTVTSKTSEDAPAVILNKAFEEVNDFRITPDISKHESFTGNTAINPEIYESKDVSSNTMIRYKHAGQSELDIGLEEIRRIFDEEKVPLHPFVDLTNSGIEKISQKSKVHGLESGLDLLKPEYSLDSSTMADNMTEKPVCHTLPCTKIDLKTKNTNISTDTTLTAEPTNMEKNEDLSNPMISSAMVQFSEIAANTENLQKKVKSHIEAVDSNPQSKTAAEMKYSTDTATKISEEAADTANSQEEVESSFTDKPTEAIDLQSAETEPVKSIEEMSLSELLKRVRERSRWENYEQIMFTSQVPEAEPCAGKPPCTPLANPPPKTLPPRPCPPKRKTDKKDKKNPCAKFKKNSALNTLGLVVTIRVPEMDIPQNYSFPEKRFDDEQIPKTRVVMLVPGCMESIIEDEKLANFSNRILSQRVLEFIREYEPWDSPFLLVTRDRRKKMKSFYFKCHRFGIN